MSQRNVQLLIGQLVTDEDLRRRFIRAPGETLQELAERGWDLTGGEIEALLQTDAQLWGRVALKLPSRLQRCSLADGGEHTGRIDANNRKDRHEHTTGHCDLPATR